MNLPPIDTSGKDIVQLPVKYKPPVEGRFLLPVEPGKCSHWRGPFTVDIKAGKCICRSCNEEVSPMFVLEELMKQESQWMQTRATYQDEMKRLAERSRTKCEKCGEFTRISHK